MLAAIPTPKPISAIAVLLTPAINLAAYIAAVFPSHLLASFKGARNPKDCGANVSHTAY